MHVLIKGQSGDEVSVLCIEREVGHCHLVSESNEHTSVLLRVAESMGVPGVFTIALPGEVKELEAAGWTRRNDLMVMVKGFDNGKAGRSKLRRVSPEG